MAIIVLLALGVATVVFTELDWLGWVFVASALAYFLFLAIVYGMAFSAIKDANNRSVRRRW